MHSSDLSDLSAEPSVFQRLTPDEKNRLTEILDRYLSALEEGVPPSREELLAAHPDLAGLLCTYLDSLHAMHNAAAGFAGSQDGGEEDASHSGDEKRLGDFRLLREIGRGGMGVVYEAQQISLGRRVALKVLPFAAVLDARQIARFKHEAQAAAQLDHPNIVSVFAVGMERGVHYYAMQLIEGQPLDRALAELRKSPPSGRTVDANGVATTTLDAGNAPTVDYRPQSTGSLLSARHGNPREYFAAVVRLGVQAAEALHAAHEHGVVHRDVKPSNLLLDANGKLWITDFGLARCRNDANLTRTGDVIGTVRYMSPEQAAGQSALVDQRTDVYSLGVTLYELLALRPAYSGEDGPALLRQIEQHEPRPLRHWQPKLPPDLETVISKAMAKRREDRYTTAREFAEDLQRVLDGKPTIAKPPTIAERAGKWARRHRRAVATALAICLLAMVGMAVSMLLITRETIRAQTNSALAERRFHQARDTVDHLGMLVTEKLAGVPGPDAKRLRRELLQETLRYYRAFVDEHREDPSLRADLALTFNKIGEFAATGGAIDEAIAAHEEAIRLFEQLARDNPREPEYRCHLAVSQNNLARALHRLGRTDAARHAYREAIRLQEGLVEQSGDQYLADLVHSYNNLGLLQNDTGEKADAEKSFRQAIKLQESLLALEPDNPERLSTLAASINNLAAIYFNTEPGRATELFPKALEYQTKAADLRPGDQKYKNAVAVTLSNIGRIQLRTGQVAEAAESYARAVEIQKELVRAVPAQESSRNDLIVGLSNLGTAQQKLKKKADAEQSFRQALDLQEGLVRQNPSGLAFEQSRLGSIYNNLGMLLEEMGRHPEAANNYRQAVEHQRIAAGRAPQVARYRELLSAHYFNYGRVLRRLGRPVDAARTALARRELWPNDKKHLFAVAEELALATDQLAHSAHSAQGELSSQQCAALAVATLQQAVAAGWKPTPHDDWTKSFAAVKDYPGFNDLANK